MTSGSFHTIRLETIKVDRVGRQRAEITDVDTLADSIKRLGLIHPIVITRDLALVAGERRLVACKSLGWENIAAQYTDEVDPQTLFAIELEENVKRKDLTWQEQCRAIEEYHHIRLEEDPEWNQVKTAEALGLSNGTVTESLAIMKEHNRGNSRILEQPRLSTAKGIAARDYSRRIESIVAATTGTKTTTPSSILNADFNEWVKTYDGPKFNFIHCDFPYGIEANKMQQGGSVATHGGYDDSENTYWSLCSSLCSNLDRIAAKSCHIMFWFSMHYYSSTIDYLARNSNFKIDPFPLIWLKSDNIGLLPDPQRGPRRIYESALFGSRGDRKIVASVSNAIAAPTDRSQHMSTKPQFVLQHFFRMFVDEYSSVLDPTCGSGSALRAAESCGANAVLGIERDREFAERAGIALDAYRRMKNG